MEIVLNSPANNPLYLAKEQGKDKLQNEQDIIVWFNCEDLSNSLCIEINKRV